MIELFFISTVPSASVKRGYPQINPSGTPYAPSLATAALNELPSSVGFSQAIIVSKAAFAADVADEAPLE